MCTRMCSAQEDREEKKSLILSMLCENDRKGVRDMLKNNDMDIDEILFFAIEKGNEECLERLQELGTDFNVCTPSGETALSYACLNHQLQCAETLVRLGADVNAIGMDFETPLSRLASDPEESFLEEITFLVGHGASTTKRTGSQELSPLFHSLWERKTKVAEFLIEKGASIGEDGVFQSTSSLGMAIQQSVKPSLIKLLLAHANNDFINMTQHTDTGETLLTQTVEHHDPLYAEMVTDEILLRGGIDVNARNNFGYTALMLAVDESRGNIVEKLLCAGAVLHKNVPEDWLH